MDPPGTPKQTVSIADTALESIFTYVLSRNLHILFPQVIEVLSKPV